MTNNSPKNSRTHGRWLFVQEFLKHPLQIGSIVPSSRFLEQRIVEAAGAVSVDVIIELGPGTGGVTRAILRAMPPHAKLLTIEVNQHLNRLVSRIEDDRLITHLGSASELKEIIALYGLEPPNAIVSGIPFSTMNRHAGSQIIETIASLLAPDGRFVAYQVHHQVAALGEPVLGSAQVAIELLNIPPMRIFRWVKQT